MSIHIIRLELELDEPSGIYTITSPDVPGLVTEGSSPAEITQNVQEAIECLLEGWTKHNMEIPPALSGVTRLMVKRLLSPIGAVKI